jgi:hypothetical protein
LLFAPPEPAKRAGEGILRLPEDEPIIHRH